MVLRTERFQPFEQRPCGFPIRLPGSRRQNRKRQQLEMRYLPGLQRRYRRAPPQLPAFRRQHPFRRPQSDRRLVSARRRQSPDFGDDGRRSEPAAVRQTGEAPHSAMEKPRTARLCQGGNRRRHAVLQTTLQRTDHPVAGSSFRNRRRHDPHPNGQLLYRQRQCPFGTFRIHHTPRRPAIRKSRVDERPYRQICDSQRRGGQSREVPRNGLRYRICRNIRM